MTREQANSSADTPHESRKHLGSLKTPIYETSTFVFETAEEGKRFFQVAYGLVDGNTPGSGNPPGSLSQEFGYIYSRLDSPNARATEAQLAVLENAEDAVLFNSGMAAISTVFLTYLQPGLEVLYSTPAYGGTAALLEGMFSNLGIVAKTFTADTTENDLRELIDGDLAMVYVESPANPTNDIFDIAMAARVAHANGAILAVDNTFLTPVWQRPLELGADISLHSATKYLGGHSDLTAGVVCGSTDELEELRHNRYRVGTTVQPHTAWLLGRSLETLSLRVQRQTETATRVAEFLDGHAKVGSVNHLSLLIQDDPRYATHHRQATGPGAMIAFEVLGGEEEAFRFLNAMRLVHLAVSLGGTESLASHPWTMSHSTMEPDDKEAIGVTSGLIRLSIGVEESVDLIADLDQALATV
jgi:methionine-gamma-lyase